MRSGTSSCKDWFNATLFRKNMTRFWPIWALYGAIQFFLLPVELFRLSANWEHLPAILTNDFHVATRAGIPLGLCFGCLLAMALFSYLMNPRSVFMFHTLPIRREGLLLTNYVSALAAFTLPNIAVALLALLAEVRLGVFCPLGVTRWLVAQIFLGMFFFSFAVCCAMFTGHILALPVFYGVLNFLALGLSFMVDVSMTALLVGYSSRGAFHNSTVIQWLTPAFHLLDLLTNDNPGDYVEAICYCLVGIALFTCIALLAYQRRHLERAGDVVSVAWARPVFQWGVTLCAGLAGAIVLYWNFFDSSGPKVFIALAGLSALVGSFTARALLKKSLRVLAEGWKSILVPSLAILFLLGGAYADLFGYQRWTPNAGEVVSVDIFGAATTPYDSARHFSQFFTDPDQIQAVVDIHTRLVQELPRLQAAWLDSSSLYAADENGFETAGATSINVTYTMADGTIAARSYDIVPISAQDLSDPDSYAGRLQALLNQPRLVEEAYFPSAAQFGAAEIRRVEAVTAQIGSRGDEAPFFSYDDANRLWNAVLEDIRAGRVHRYLLEDEERMQNCYYTDLYFTLNFQTGYAGSDSWDSQSTTVLFTPQKSAASSMAVLEELGLLDQLQAREDIEKYGDALPTQSQSLPAEAEEADLPVDSLPPDISGAQTEGSVSG